MYYYCTHIGPRGQIVCRTWNTGRHLAINIDVKHWPEIPPVLMDIGRELEALYGPSFSKDYFMGIANISKMESEVPRKKKSLCESHNQYHGNRVAAHTDSPREGEVIITLQLIESIIFSSQARQCYRQGVNSWSWFRLYYKMSKQLLLQR